MQFARLPDCLPHSQLTWTETEKPQTRALAARQRDLPFRLLQNENFFNPGRQLDFKMPIVKWRRYFPQN